MDGGAPNTSIIQIDELQTRKFSAPILRCFIAEGIDEGHALFLASSTDEKLDALLANVPEAEKETLKEAGGSVDDGRRAEPDEMKIAWRYTTVPEINSHIGEKENFRFDLSKKREHLDLGRLSANGLFYRFESV